MTAAGTEPTRARRTARLVLRLGFGLVSAALLLFTLAFATAFLQTLANPVAERLEPQQPQGLGAYDTKPIEDLLASSPERSLSSRLSVEQLENAPDADRVALAATLTLTGALDQPIIDFVRRGDARDPDVATGLMNSTAGHLDLGNTPVEFTSPVVRQGARTSTVTTTAQVILDRDQASSIRWSYPDCRIITARVLEVQLVDLPLTGVSQQGLPDGCPAGGWSAQTDRSARFAGKGQAVAMLGSPARTAPSSAAPRTVSAALAGNARYAVYVALSALPLFLVWRNLRKKSTTKDRAVVRICAIFAALLSLQLLNLVGVGINLAVLPDGPGLVHRSGVALARADTWLSLHSWPTLPGGAAWRTEYLAPLSSDVLDLSYVYGLGPAALMVTFAFIWRRASLRAVLRRPSPAIYVARSLLVGLMSLSGVVVAAYLLAAAQPDPTWLSYAIQEHPETVWISDPMAVAGVVAALAVLAVGAAVGLARVVGARAATLCSVGAGVGVLLVISLFGASSYRQGWVNALVQAVPPVITGALVWLALERLVRHGINADPPASWSRIRATLHSWRGLRFPIALVLAFPIITRSAAPDPMIRTGISWYDFSRLMSSLDSCVPLVGVGLLIILLRHFSRRSHAADSDQQRLSTLSMIRDATVMIAVIGLFAPTVTAAHLPLSFLLGWFLFAVWLIPARRIPEVVGAVGPAARREVRASLTALTRESSGRSARRTLLRDLRKGIATDADTPAEQDARMARIVALDLQDIATTRHSSSALGGYAGRPPWSSARELGVAALVIGLPWTVVDIATAFQTVSGTGHFRITDAIGGTTVLLRFGLAGLILGAAYPIIRGATGLAKALHLFLALLGPALCLTLLPDPRADAALSAAVLQTAQLLSVSLALGIYADLRTLRRNGLGIRQLREIYQLGGVAASVSSLVLAVVTATVTAVGTGAAGVVVDRLFTPAPVAVSPSTPPSASPTPGR